MLNALRPVIACLGPALDAGGTAKPRLRVPATALEDETVFGGSGDW